MKKQFSVLIILMAFTAFLFMSCTNEAKNSGGDSNGSSTTVLSGKIYGCYADVYYSVSFAPTGNSCIFSYAGVAASGTYSISGSTITANINGETMIMTYISSQDCIIYDGITLNRL